MPFARFDSAAFLRDCWQKKPTIIRDPWAGWSNPLDPDELAGLACESEVESRLVERSDGRFVLEHGPFEPVRFAALGAAAPWTLLVQSVDHHVPAVAALRDAFDFLPDWRIDDVMVSYASDRGGVGAHFDQYDVFLIQGLGRRTWQLGGPCDDTSALLPHDTLRLLENFEAHEEWTLEPGDILYIPPRIAHNGIAVGADCMTYSVGFRAPSRSELIAGWSESILAEPGDDDRYRDPEPLPPDCRGEIGAATVSRLQAMMAEALLDRAGFARWFGSYTTQARHADVDWRPDQPVTPDEAHATLQAGLALLRNPAARFAFIRQGPAALDLFVDGECYPCVGECADFAEFCCANRRFVPTTPMAASPEVLALVVELANRGAIAFDTDE